MGTSLAAFVVQHYATAAPATAGGVGAAAAGMEMGGLNIFERLLVKAAVHLAPVMEVVSLVSAGVAAVAIIGVVAAFAPELQTHRTASHFPLCIFVHMFIFNKNQMAPKRTVLYFQSSVVPKFCFVSISAGAHDYMFFNAPLFSSGRKTDFPRSGHRGDAHIGDSSFGTGAVSIFCEDDFNFCQRCSQWSFHPHRRAGEKRDFGSSFHGFTVIIFIHFTFFIATAI